MKGMKGGRVSTVGASLSRSFLGDSTLRLRLTPPSQATTPSGVRGCSDGRGLLWRTLSGGHRRRTGNDPASIVGHFATPTSPSLRARFVISGDTSGDG